MRNCMYKTTFREIKQSFGRYFAILSIVALGVGFFGGLRVTTPVFVEAGDTYVKEMALFDYRLMNTLGFEEEDVEAFLQDENVLAAEGAFSEDFLCSMESGEVYVIKAHSLTADMNKLDVLEGRLPENSDECVLDRRAQTLAGFTELKIGDVITLSDSNSEETMEHFVHDEYKIVGFVNASYYLNYERGTSKIGSGKVNGFVYIPMEGFDTEYYSEIFVKLKEERAIFSEEYDALIDGTEKGITDICKAQAMRRYQSIVDEAQAEIDNAKSELADAKQEAEVELAEAYDELVSAQDEVYNAVIVLDGQEEALKLQEAQLLAVPDAMRPFGAMEQIEAAKQQIRKGWAEIADAQQEIDNGWIDYEEGKAELEAEIADAEEEIAEAQEELDDLEEPDSYVLTRDTNVGYACFENDSDILESISLVFPVFFFLVAALVCMTTMNRMVEEQRTQIGVLKALGYSDRTIMGKYIFYAGSAAVIGGVIGFAGLCYLFPEIIWAAYGIMYGFAPITYKFDVPLFLVSMAGALLCSVGATYYTCRVELYSTAAQLIRPKAPKSGKRIIFERIPFLWNRLKFLQKVSVRNLFRYKKRFFMMVIGIGGCTALLVTGYGLKDSISGTVEKQYGEIQLYDAMISFEEEPTDEQVEILALETKDVTKSLLCVREETVTLEGKDIEKECTLVIPKSIESFGDYIDLHKKSGETISYPDKGEAVLTEKIADKLGVQTGDSLDFRDDDGNAFTCTISGICDNYVYNYVYINAETYQEATGAEPEYVHALVNIREAKDLHEAAALISEEDYVSGVSLNLEFKERFDSMIVTMDYLVVVIIICAGALAFIVLYNLTNINITERIREIATIKVLGFYPGETASYVFKENFALTAFGALAGLVMGYGLHCFIMANIDLETIAFDVHVGPVSYLISFLITFVFTIIVDVVMYFKLDNINMVESLKSIE
ncbi:MAG: ABC transporter permease [Lachnospiraceae bacterium]|nr:ABC transporter permease [Lachnospiraceae bacterium]